MNGPPQFELKKPALNSSEIEKLLDDLRAFRIKIAKPGKILKAGETWNNFARDGLN